MAVRAFNRKARKGFAKFAKFAKKLFELEKTPFPPFTRDEILFHRRDTESQEQNESFHPISRIL